MTRPGDRDGFEEREGSGWQEPAHLGGGDDPSDDRPNIADRRKEPRDDDAAPWQPPGWDLPAAEPGFRPQSGPAEPSATPAHRPEPVSPAEPVEPAEDRSGGGEQQGGARTGWAGFGTGRRGARGEVDKVFAYQGDLVGAQGWALQHGWSVSDGTAPEDAPLRDLVAAGPVRLSKDHRPAGVLRGRADQLDMVAFDVLYASGRYLVPEYAVTAVPLLSPVPYFRLSPARFWKHRISGLVAIETGDPEFDRRWQLFAAEDWPGVRRLAADPTVRALLLNTDDGDEFWSAAGHIAAIRPDGHRASLIEHHGRLLTAVVRAVAGGT